MRLPSRESLLNAIKPRGGVRIFGVGAAKTGTHSIGEMFSASISTSHEKDCEKLIQLHLDREMTRNDSSIRRFLWLRDRYRNLKIDSSQVNIYLIDDLERLFPQSRYLMTVRQPIDWLRSKIDDCLRRDTSETWYRFRDYRFGAKASVSEEVALQLRGLYSIEGYLNYWNDAINRVLQRIEPDRLLAVNTDEISSQVVQIAQFCGISADGVTAEDTKSFVNPERFGVLNELDPNYLTDKTEQLCGDLSRRLFPDYSIEVAVTKLRSG